MPSKKMSKVDLATIIVKANLDKLANPLVETLKVQKELEAIDKLDCQCNDTGTGQYHVEGCHLYVKPMEQQTMPEATPTVTETDSQKLATFKANNPEKVQTLPAGTQADAMKADTDAFMAKGEEALESKEEPVPDPMTFDYLTSTCSDIPCYVIKMSFQEARDYCSFASDMYDEETKKDLEGHINQTWQRKKSTSRATKAAEYLKRNPHFFPPLIAVPSHNLAINGGIVVEAKSLLMLDGQHRFAGILEYLKLCEEKGVEVTDSIFVVVLQIDPTDIELKQQIFADINRAPVKVPKAIALMYDHKDRAGNFAKEVVSQDWCGNLVECGRTNPKNDAFQIMSFTNLHNLILPMTELWHIVDGDIVTDGKPNKVKQLTVTNGSDIIAIVKAVIDNLPRIEQVRSEIIWNYKALKDEYPVYSSTLWQALGITIANVIQAKHSDGKTSKTPIGEVPATIEHLMRTIGNKENNWDGWQKTNVRWSNVYGKNAVLNEGGSVGTQKGNITAAIAVLSESLPEVAPMEPVEPATDAEVAPTETEASK